MNLKYIISALLFLAAPFSLEAAVTDRYMIEAESFQFKGKWFAERSGECMGSSMLRLGGGGSLEENYDALTMVEILEAGEYTVWVRSADFAKRQGTRRFRLSVNEQPMAESGAHGKEGWYWEKVGSICLDKGPALLRLHDSNRNFGRCDAILLCSDSSLNPNEVNRKEIGKWRRNPAKIKTESTGLENVSAPVDAGYDAAVLASAGNPEIKLDFVKTGSGAIACRTEINVNGIWRRFCSDSEDNRLFLIYSQGNEIGYEKFYPSWKEPVAESRFAFGGREYVVRSDEDYMNPFVSGVLSEAIPVSVEQRGEGSIAVHYITKNGSVIDGIWTVPAKGHHLTVELSCTAAEAGMYSMALAAFQPLPETMLGNVLMPPMFQFRRVPGSPVLMPSAMMQQPLSMIECRSALSGVLSSFVSGDDSLFSGEWGSVDCSPIGFTLRNHTNAVQPCAFSPIIGMEDSRLDAGQKISRRFVIGLSASDWTDELAYISDKVYKVRDYRRQEETSLTDAVFNIWDLMSDSEHGGWNDSLKGFYDIEGDPGTAPTVVHSAPLSIVGVASVSADEDFYIKRALPTIEYTLSRSGYRWATDLVPSGYNKTLETLNLNPFKSQFNTSYYEGLNSLLGGLNPWLEELALPGGEVRQTKGYSAPVVSWVQFLAAYRLTGDSKWLVRTLETAERYVNLHIYTKSDQPSGDMAFYNSQMYPAWWNLLDLYEMTGDVKWLDAARYGAASTIAGIRCYPAVSDGLQTIHPGGKFEGNTTMWWKGKEKFRLGYPRVEGDSPEKQVPVWKVSPVGLGFEQPGTYFLRQKGKKVRPVFMSSWAPHLLRLYANSGEEIYQTYARNAVIGRFSNYPGYYATGYTDITMSADFPYKGPDVSSIYYHHIPPHLAFTWDFLVSEAIGRAKGNVSFPYSLQEGFVWFSNRIYGAGNGRIFSDRNARLWMKRGLIAIDRPEVNYLTAVSDKNFWILLSNESDNETVVNLRLGDVVSLLLPGKVASLYTETGKSSKLPGTEDSLAVTIPAKGFRAVALPVAKTKKEAVQPLQHGMKVIDGGETFGKIFLFRIRSPFGWDSVYGFAETAPQKGRKLSVSVRCNGEETTVSGYPFEWSFLKLGLDEKAVVSMTFREEGKADRTEEITLDFK